MTSYPAPDIEREALRAARAHYRRQHMRADYTPDDAEQVARIALWLQSSRRAHPWTPQHARRVATCAVADSLRAYWHTRRDGQPAVEHHAHVDVRDHAPGPEAIVDARMTLSAIVRCALSRPEALMLHAMLDDQPDRTVARAMGVTEACICQRRTAMVARLRRILHHHTG